MCMLRLYRRQKEYGFDLRGPGWHGESCRQILHLGVPSSLQNGMIALSNVAVQSGINLFGTKAIAGCGVWSKLEGFGLLPILSFTMALSTFTGQNKGAQNPERIRKGTVFGICCCAAISLVISVILYIFAPYFVRIFNQDPEVAAYGILKAHISTPFFIPASNEPSGHACMSIWRLPRGSNTPQLCCGVFDFSGSFQLYRRNPPGNGEDEDLHGRLSGLLVSGAYSAGQWRTGLEEGSAGGAHRLSGHLVFEYGHFSVEVSKRCMETNL